MSNSTLRANSVPVEPISGLQNVVADASDGACRESARLCRPACRRRRRPGNWDWSAGRRISGQVLIAGPPDAVTAGDVSPVGAVVIEEIELDQLDALVFEVEQRAGHAAQYGKLAGEEAGREGRHVAGTPVLRPVDPGGHAELFGFVAAAAEGSVSSTLP